MQFLSNIFACIYLNNDEHFNHLEIDRKILDFTGIILKIEIQFFKSRKMVASIYAMI